jgi:hypothetical protein
VPPISPLFPYRRRSWSERPRLRTMYDNRMGWPRHVELRTGTAHGAPVDGTDSRFGTCCAARWDPNMCTTAIVDEARPAMDIETKLHPVPESAKKARRFVRDQLVGLGFPKNVDDACLIVDELASNAIAAAPKTPFWVAVAVRHGWPILMVQDCSPELPEVQPADVTSERGRGLRIVEALARNWDVFPVTGGKIVWVLLERG